jgi:hypothetical protein
MEGRFKGIEVAPLMYAFLELCCSCIFLFNLIPINFNTLVDCVEIVEVNIGRITKSHLNPPNSIQLTVAQFLPKFDAVGLLQSFCHFPCNA